MTPDRFALRAVGLGLLVTIALVIVIWLKVGADEHSSCVIQARGLRAGHALADVIGDIHTLVSVPLTPQQQQALARSPMPVAEAYRDLNVQAYTYFRLEAQQPWSRAC